MSVILNVVEEFIWRITTVQMNPNAEVAKNRRGSQRIGGVAHSPEIQHDSIVSVYRRLSLSSIGSTFLDLRYASNIRSITDSNAPRIKKYLRISASSAFLCFRFLSNAGIARNPVTPKDNTTDVIPVFSGGVRIMPRGSVWTSYQRKCLTQPSPSRPKNTGIQMAYKQPTPSNLDSGIFRAWTVTRRARVIRREKTGMTACGCFV